MSNCIVQPSVNLPQLYNWVVNRIQADLVTDCSWIQYLFPIAEIGERRKTNKANDTALHKYPQIYKNDGTTKYIDVFPKEQMNSYCFFELEPQEAIYDFTETEELQKIGFNLIVWVNLKLVDDTKAYDYTDTLIASVVESLKHGYFSNEIVSVKAIVDKNKIFDRYDYTFEELKNIAYPYSAFKLNFEMLVPDDIACIPLQPTDPCVADGIAAAFSADMTSTNVGIAIQFTDASTGSPTSWAWDFGDGTSSFLQNPVKIYLVAGTYTVKLIAAKEGAGDIEIKTAYITIEENVITPYLMLVCDDIRRLAIYNFAKTIQNNSLYDKINFGNLMLCDLAVSSKNFVDITKFPITFANFVESDLNTSGLLGDGATKSGNNTYNPFDELDDMTDGGMDCIITSESAIAGNDFGINVADKQMLVSSLWAGGTFGFYYWGKKIPTVANTTSLAIWSLNSDPVNFTVYKNGVQFHQEATDAPDAPPTVFGFWMADVQFTSFSDRRILAFIHRKSMSPAQYAIYYSALNTLKNAIT